MDLTVFNDIKNKLNIDVPEVLHVDMFNNQVELLRNELNNKDDGDYSQSIYDFQRPATLIEFVAPNEIKQLGNGYQLFDPLLIKVHILIDFYNNDNKEQAPDAFTIKNKIFQSLQKFEATNCVAFIRTSEEQDYNHGNMYYYVQTYTTNYVDGARKEPVGGTVTVPPTTLDLTASLEIDNILIRTGSL